MSIQPGRWICPVCEITLGEPEVFYTETPVCHAPTHLKPAVMVRLVATAAERQRKSRKRRMSA